MRIIEKRAFQPLAVTLQDSDKRAPLQVVGDQLLRNIGQAQSQAGGFRFHIAVGKSPLPLRPVGNFFTLLIQLPGVKATVAKLVSDTGMDD